MLGPEQSWIDNKVPVTPNLEWNKFKKGKTIKAIGKEFIQNHFVINRSLE